MEGIKQILASVDGTDKDRAVLDYALQVALHFASHIDVLHVRFDVHGGASMGTGYERRIDRLLGISVERAATDNHPVGHAGCGIARAAERRSYRDRPDAEDYFRGVVS